MILALTEYLIQDVMAHVAKNLVLSKILAAKSQAYKVIIMTHSQMVLSLHSSQCTRMRERHRKDGWTHPSPTKMTEMMSQ